MEDGHQALMAKFLKSYPSDRSILMAVLWCLARAKEESELPPSVLEALEERGLNPMDEIRRAVADVARIERPDPISTFSNIGCAVGVGLFFVILTLGIVSLVRIVAGWFGA